MPDPIVTPETPAVTPEIPAPVPDKTVIESSSLVKPDGSFVENWYDHEMLPEGYRGSESLKVLKNLPDLVKRTVNAEKMVGKNKVAIPTEKSTPAEWDAYYAAGGRPKTPGGYKIEVPEDMKALYPEERLAEIKKFAHEQGFSAKQVDAYMKYELASMAKILSDQEQAEERVNAETALALKKEFGAAYDERIHIGNRLIAEAFGNDKEGELVFTQKYGNDPDFIRFAAKVGVKLVEHKALIADLTEHTPSEANAKVAQLQATPGYMNPGSGMAKEERESITAKIREQMKIAYPEPNARKTV